tara:strand:+ start:878 stop:1168 length:291 start_codon:yes stop_codon:yes gene_type:complete
MNYLAHLYLAKPTADSHFGNLLGDFGGQRQVTHLPTTVKSALDNHYLVDKFTDTHPLVKEAKQLFSAKRRRLQVWQLMWCLIIFLLRIGSSLITNH